ncbi:hypothetical protein J40TS1_32410 [Paenibacillus montaniterrae]|uniref:Uncharacterized protein n=1 Tax=Paenibacillus montaniterrae TaxID=429341 RepID=A0A919YSY7_9BACL|nr:hypothetical protein [Paenibacillus montaniterrae]GIP17599.1 hypothetical protein J40TS1_32410 [Paenibacillus montaniterrae]
MTKAKPGIDKNLQNVVNELDTPDLNAHANQQLNQKHMDQRHEDMQHFRKKAYENENQE